MDVWPICTACIWTKKKRREVLLLLLLLLWCVLNLLLRIYMPARFGGQIKWREIRNGKANLSLSICSILYYITSPSGNDMIMVRKKTKNPHTNLTHRCHGYINNTPNCHPIARTHTHSVSIVYAQQTKHTKQMLVSPCCKIVHIHESLFTLRALWEKIKSLPRVVLV